MGRRTKISEYEDRITDAQIARAKRQVVREKIRTASIDPYDFEGYQVVYIDYEPGWGDESASFTLVGEREETDSDVRTRLATRLQSREAKKRMDKEKNGQRRERERVRSTKEVS